MKSTSDKPKIYRPINDEDFPQKNYEKDILSYMVFFGRSKKDAFLLFHREYYDPKTNGLNKAGQEHLRNFFSLDINKKYIEDYKASLDKWFNGFDLASPDELEVSDERKDNALQKLLHQAMSIIEKNDELNPDTLKIVAEIFKKVGLLKDEVEQQEAPRRYLPERCSTCLYKSFVESHVESGEIENACLRCKALKVAQEQGFHYDPTNLLEPINNNDNGDKSE